MTYVHEPSRVQQSKDLAAFVTRSLLTAAPSESARMQVRGVPSRRRCRYGGCRVGANARLRGACG